MAEEVKKPAKDKLPFPDENAPNYVEQLLNLCKWSEITDRYDDMCEYLKKLLDAKEGDLTEEERNHFSVGFKSIVGNLRRSWRSLNPPDPDETQKKGIKEYQTYIQDQIDEVCNTVVGLINDKILPKEEAKVTVDSSEDEKRACAEAQTFYHKMVGDYERYKAELRPKEKSDLAANAYKKAMGIAAPLPDTDSTKLGLALNYSVCLFEIKKDKQEAVNVAKNAFDNALKKLDELDDNDYKNSTLIMQLLRDNLTLWTSEAEAPPQED